MASWRIGAFAWNDASTIREIRAATNRKLTLRLRAPSTLSFSVSGDHPQAAMIQELVTDVQVNDGATAVFWGRCFQATDTAGDSKFTTNFTFMDYRQVLARRELRQADTVMGGALEKTYLGDQGALVGALLGAAQARANGNYGITQGVGATTGVSREILLRVGDSIGDTIQDISELSSGFDWDVSPGKLLNVYYPNRGLNNGVGLEYGKTVQSFTRTKASGAFANDTLATGGSATIPASYTSGTVGADAMGRWDVTESFPSISIQATLASRATFIGQQKAQLLPTYNVQLVPGFWKGESHIGRGDTVRLRVKRGRVNDNALFRVNDISVELGNDGADSVRLGLTPL